MVLQESTEALRLDILPRCVRRPKFHDRVILILRAKTRNALPPIYEKAPCGDTILPRNSW